jgi:prolyl-tRNA editing enzyme YbaK/EbsC (Cys-tRNA(Pro) deacylase)
MSNVEAVKAYLKSVGLDDHYLEFAGSSATVELAAQQLGCEPDRIAKTIACIKKEGGAYIIVAKGTARIDNGKFKRTFGEKPHFVPANLLPELVGHPMGGVCPFVLKDACEVYLDESLKAFDVVYPAAGAHNNAVRVTIEELERITTDRWVDVTK